MGTDRLVEQVEKMMADSGTGRWVSVASALGAAAAVYGGAMALRAGLYRRRGRAVRRLTRPVVSVGNLTVGGTGKTPMVAYLARRLMEAGLRPAVVSRGYLGGSERTGGIVSDGRRILMPPAAAGDEPWMLAGLLDRTPVVVGRDRWRAGRIAEGAFSPDVILLDDGFQHLRLARDIDLVLLDAASPFGNGRVFPRGPLREPASALARADALVLTRCRDGGTPAPAVLAQSRAAAGKPILRAVHRARLRAVVPAGGRMRCAAPAVGAPDLRGRRVAVFSGIARNEDVSRSVRELGGQVAAAFGFKDHHRYRPAELSDLECSARRGRAEWMATTEKDFARLGGVNPFRRDLAVLGIDMELASGEAVLSGLFKRRLLRR